jgi:hypothetical protein
VALQCLKLLKIRKSGQTEATDKALLYIGGWPNEVCKKILHTSPIGQEKIFFDLIGRPPI